MLSTDIIILAIILAADYNKQFLNGFLKRPALHLVVAVENKPIYLICIFTAPSFFQIYWVEKNRAEHT